MKMNPLQTVQKAPGVPATQSCFQKIFIGIFTTLLILSASAAVLAKENRATFPQRSAVTSPEVLQDGKITLRVLAPEAKPSLKAPPTSWEH